ncbi:MULTISPECIES: erythromycin resistance leader peptide [Bacillales]|uniref:Uncharacterized protein n=3 Tax=Bacillaceae TaxID=186817 RepID=A0A494Z8C0_9BACI|nr:erythromycin resistance leader peptide [Bacillus sp. NSP9.1]RKQ18861.1 hypothetical protein D8M05_00660 [Oceanobacillus bengalensis]RTR27908.1 hypothetical protein EKG37_18585 [Bacillus yapensis]TKC20086.1 hypothetical protein FA727_00525 [Robertmurraya kyonggiensis]TKS94311.1 hypothetical protein FAR12_18595 [Bacillus yapensis]
MTHSMRLRFPALNQ